MKMGEAIGSVFSHYAVFSGRARRSEYWYFMLFNALVIFVIAMVAGALSSDDSASLVGIVLGIWHLLILLPSFAVSVRRLHDIGKSGWWILIAVIPVIGAILLLLWTCKDSQSGENAYGPNPKGC